jgi:uncharacterized protein YdeI (YjbR/CyaY-like superfamily)
MNPKVDFYFDRGKKWDKENAKLRKIILSTGLNEELKWGCPCYTHESANVVLIHDFNEYCAVLFFKGSLLNDAEGVLIQQTKNVQGARQMRFTSLKEVNELEKTLKAYVYEAIEVERAGLKVKLKETTEFDMPEEFEKKLNKSASLKKAFYKLTPGRQRGYLLFFAAPKLAKTREERVAKYTKHILSGKGLNDV